MTHPRSSDGLPTLHDILIIGAGPSGLAVAARLREHTPSALYTDEEHRRFHWLRNHAGESSVKNRKTGRITAAACSAQAGMESSIIVLDAEGSDWLTRWHGLFDALRISHLRSPMFFHPDPRDRDALLEFAYASGRTPELRELRGAVGKEISKHKRKKRKRELGGKCGMQSRAMAPATVDERDRKDYFAPSSQMFQDFVRNVAARYELAEDGLIKQTSVQDLEYGVVPQLSHVGSAEKLFTVRTSGVVHFAKAVVLAVGAGNGPHIPAPFDYISLPHEAASHTLSLRCHHGLPQLLRDKVIAGQRTNVLVIGGGLTSAQIGDLVLRQGITKVWHLMRGSLKVKPFDIDLSWMSKFRNQEKAAYWMAEDDCERAEMLKKARGGGSMTPQYAKILQNHINAGRASLHIFTTVQTQVYNPFTRMWSLTTSPRVPDLPEMDYVYFATGVQSDVSTLPFMQCIIRDFPLGTQDGLPTLTDDLAWREDVPLFFTGKLAGLRLGPGAANLEGARAGAERIALAVKKFLETGIENDKRDSACEHGAEDRSMGKRYEAGLGSRFEGLSLNE